MTGPDIDHQEFPDIAYRVLVSEKKWSVDEVASGMGMKYHTLYSRIRGDVKFSPAELRVLLRLAPDPRFVDYLLKGTPFIAVERCDGAYDALPENVHLGATRTVIEAAGILEEVEAGLEDDKIDHRDRARIEKEIESAERALAALRAHLARVR